jgi:formylglycine-generating enzyme required for sulfatase activity
MTTPLSWPRWIVVASLLGGCSRPATVTSVDLGGGVTLDLVRVEPGRFTMGSAGGGAAERPTHDVSIGVAFDVGRHEVTQAQWRAVMGTNPSSVLGPDLPVDHVSWLDCQEFVARLSSKAAGPAFALPTEAQWEYACRAGTTTAWCCGDDERALEEFAWFRPGVSTPLSQARARPVGGKRANAWGLHDMHGNVAEWCEDAYHADYAGAPADGTAWGGSAGRVLRGGAAGSDARGATSSVRGGHDPSWRAPLVGFRVVREVAARPATDPSAPAAPPLSGLAPWDAASPAARLEAARRVSAREPAFRLLRMETFACGDQTHEIALFEHAPTGLEFALVPGRRTEGGPRPVVRVAPFLVCRTECTQAAFQKVTGTNPSARRQASHPVENVAWDDVQAFCVKAGLEVPTASQATWAAAAGTSARFCCGDDPGRLPEFAWFDPQGPDPLRDDLAYLQAPDKPTHPVGLKKPNAFGLFDVHGNVSEACRCELPQDGPDAKTGGDVQHPAELAALGRMLTWAGAGPRSGFRPVKSVRDD